MNETGKQGYIRTETGPAQAKQQTIDLGGLLKLERNDAIERCAQVAENYGRGGWTGIAAAIRALKEQP